MTQSLWIFLLTAVGISLSGVMLPGPLTAATIARGYNDKNAGALIGVGHGVIELPIIALIYFGFAGFLTNPLVRQVTGVAGGILLIVMGVMIFFTFKKPIAEAVVLPYNSLVTGIVMTGGNPYFFLWWATIGVALVASAASFGLYALLLFIIVHWSCDIAWEQVISVTVFKTRHLWTPRVQKIIFGICAAMLIGFGIYFGVSVFL
ncbi:MAG: LysE family transporter [Dehalococcoidia bacterium]|nr:LysE family transporter [Dehalococcoidia bacterium]MDD5493988.1 LysE family transporter [Dehalococcoidia bacterium]